MSFGGGFPTSPIIVPGASQIPYTPSVPSDWSPAPSNVGAALDQGAARIKALESGGGAQQIYSCPSGVAVLDLVYKTAVAGQADKADASDPTKMRAVGFAASKPTATTLILQSSGELAGFGTLTVGAEYFADPTTPGGISLVGGDPTADEVSQPVGIAKTADILTIAIATSPVAGE